MKHSLISFFHFFILSFFLVPQGICAQDEWNPVADPAAVVTSGNARFTVLTSRMVRIQYSSSALFEDRATFAIVNRRLPVPEFTTETTDGYLYIRTQDLTLRYKVGETISAADKDPEVLMITFPLNGRTVTWYPGKDDKLNLLGTCRTLDTAWGDNARNRLEKGLLSRAGWSIVDESPSFIRGDGSSSYAFEPKAGGLTWWANRPPSIGTSSAMATTIRLASRTSPRWEAVCPCHRSTSLATGTAAIGRTHRQSSSRL